MASGVSILWGELPAELAETHADLWPARLHERGGEREVRFLWRHAQPLLPVWHEGRLRIVNWGNRRRHGRLPPTGWTWLTTVEAGRWADWHAEPVDIPANFGFENGVWYRVRQGMRGILVCDEDGEAHVYMICQPATRYYQVMTRSDRMPVLIGEWI